MLINLDKLEEIADLVASSQTVESLAFDFETTGLKARAGAKAFLMGMCLDGTLYAYFFTGGLREADVMRRLFSNPRVKYLAHNAKFEMSFLLEQWGVELLGHAWCTETMARVQYNNHRSYSLQACAERIGETKYPPMLAWLKKNGHDKYHAAPHDIIIPYVLQDARLSWLLYQDQRDTFREWHKSDTPPAGLVMLEMRTTKNLFKMEYGGILFDVDYATKALEYEKDRAKKAKEEFSKLTGVSFVDSGKCLAPVFTTHGIPFGKTEAGGPSFNAKALAQTPDHPIVQAIIAYRDANKRVSSYWENMLAMQHEGRLYFEVRQAGAATGRFSIIDPAAQTWPDDSEDPTCAYPIRRAFPAPPGCLIVSMDYKGMELRFGVDQVEDHRMIELIQTGADLHQRIADSANVARNLGKRGRFLRQYGGGVEKMSESLNIPMPVATRICKALDNESPPLRDYGRGLIRSLRGVGAYGNNWMGRRYYFDRGFEYKYPNYWNQGGCSEILRVAIDDITDFLEKNAHPTTRIAIPIHDELVFYWDERDMHLLAPVRDLMIKAYRVKKHLEMDVSAAKGKNFHDLTEIEAI